MTKVEIDFPGATFTQDVVVAVPQPTSPSTATPPDIGLVEISAPKVLIPGPPGPTGPTGATGAPGADGADGSPDTAAQVLAKLITVDGSGSELDADTLDGHDGTYYLDWDNFTDKPATFPPTVPIPWTDVSGKPATFPPTVPIPYSDISGKPATFPPTLPIPASGISGSIDATQHGNLPGGALHAAASSSTPGFFTDAASDGTQYVRKNGAWAAVVVPPGTYVGDAPPASPTNGQLWWESDTGNFFIWYVDATGPGQWVQINAAPANMPPVPPSDGGEYTMVNGIWRLKSQTFKPVAASQIVPIPSTAKLAKINATLWLSASAAGSMRWSLDGTTFPGGASDYTYSGQFMYGGSTANSKGPQVNLSYVPIWGLHDVVATPVHLQALLSVAKATATSASYFTMQSRSTAFNSASTLNATEYLLWAHHQAALLGATQMAAFQIYPTAGTLVAGTTIEVEWIY